ncbi:MAG: amidohydrolase [Lentisphaeria bacterium]|nr:amidohydrolase [Lentisphaeria bacterium]
MNIDFLSAIDAKQDEIIKLADTIWENPEIAFKEYKSSAAIISYLKENDFEIEDNIGGIPTAFIASYGSGHPEIGFIAEFDAISDLSQAAQVAVQQKDPNCVHGHACGHHLYGAGAVAAALAVQNYLKKTGKKGTVKVLGCPGEEGGSGKAFMARTGVFRFLDAAMGGHPECMWAVRTRPSLACCNILYRFDGRASHAGASPHLGRSALDAVELMNVAVNFLREHIPYDNRVHYAITDAGGNAPNVVQPHAEVMYMMRAKDNADLNALCKRVHKCAEGAALATETTFSSEFHSASSNLITISVLQKNLYKAMASIPLPQPDEEDLAFGRELAKTIVNRKADSPLYPTELLPLPDVIAPHFGSTDTGDVSWNCPTVQMHVGCWIPGTPNHGWQTVAQGKNGFARRAMLYTGKALALAAIQLFEEPQLLEEAKKEHLAKTGGVYEPAMPADVMPHL